MREPADLADRIGSADYYYGRHEDFAGRHADLEPPPYYLQYGLKYFQRFEALREKLSDEGKAWVARTARLLQRSIEDVRSRDPRSFDDLECDRDRFQRFAYDTHPAAYLAGGLGGLPAEDVLLVVNAPDARDLLTHAGIAQVVNTAMAVVEKNGARRNVAFVEEAARSLGAHLQRQAVQEANVWAAGADELRAETVKTFDARRRDVSDLVEAMKRFARTPWIMRQAWTTPLFCSWRLPPAAIRPLVPPQLELDLFEGAAWLSVVPLEMADVGFVKPSLPALPPFPEVNVRTYVRHKNAPGVHFLSLECGQSMIDLAAGLLFHLPYRFARVAIEREGDWFRCDSRRGDEARLHCRYRPVGSPASPRPGSLDEFLVERYALFVVEPILGRVQRGDVRHEPWRVQPAEVEIAVDSLLPSLGLPVKRRPDHVGFSPGVGTETLPFVAAG